MRSRRDPLRGLWAGTDGNMSNQAGGSQRGRVLKETAGKGGGILGSYKKLVQGNLPESYKYDAS